MKQEKITSIILEKIKKLSLLIHKVGEDFDKEAIHKFRVEVKTFRSFLEMLNIHINNKNLKLTTQFKQLYSIAGNIRVAQLEIEKLSLNDDLLSDYIIQLNKQIEDGKEEWKKLNTIKILKKLEDKLIQIKYEPVPIVALANFFNVKLDDINSLSETEDASDDELHNIRKYIKDIVFASDFVHQKWKKATESINEIPVKQLEHIASSIGEYNDKRTLVDRLSTYSTVVINPNEKEIIADISQQSIEELKNKKKNILTSVRDIFNKTAKN